MGNDQMGTTPPPSKTDTTENITCASPLAIGNNDFNARCSLVEVCVGT